MYSSTDRVIKGDRPHSRTYSMEAQAKLLCLQECGALQHGSQTRIVTLRLHLRYCRAQEKRPQVIDLERLRDQPCMRALAIEIMSRFEALQSLDSATHWDTFKEETLEAARRTVGFHPWSDRSSHSQEKLSAVSESHAARLERDKCIIVNISEKVRLSFRPTGRTL